MKLAWWKYVCILLLLYSFVAGLLIPLKSGIVEVKPGSLKSGTRAELEVKGYNTHFTEGKDQLRIWLKLDNEHALAAASFDVRDDNTLLAVFDIPTELPFPEKVHDFALMTDNKRDGASILPSAVFITKQDTAGAQAAWVNASVNDLSNNHRITFPFRNILAETIRNTYFHVPLWFGMFFLFIMSMLYSIRYLKTMDMDWDVKAVAFTRVGLVFGLLGLITGAIWAKHTWGAYWSWDVKQNMAAISILIYLAYFVLRNSFEDEDKKARIAATYNIFAFASLVPLLFVIPRMTDSLHPGNGGNPAFGSQDLDNTMRLVFYPAVLGFILLGNWISQLLFRLERLAERHWSAES